MIIIAQFIIIYFGADYNNNHRSLLRGEHMVVDYDAIGVRIRKVRTKANMTQEVLAERAGLTPVHISNIETGNTKLSLPAIINIANALGVSVDELLCDNVVRSTHVFNKEAQELLADCSPYDIRILVDILKASKEALRKDGRFRQNLERAKNAD